MNSKKRTQQLLFHNSTINLPAGKPTGRSFKID